MGLVICAIVVSGFYFGMAVVKTGRRLGLRGFSI